MMPVLVLLVLFWTVLAIPALAPTFRPRFEAEATDPRLVFVPFVLFWTRALDQGAEPGNPLRPCGGIVHLWCAGRCGRSLAAEVPRVCRCGGAGAGGLL